MQIKYMVQKGERFMKKERIEKLLGESQFKEMITTQLISWELSLKRQELSDKTIERKIKNILDFYTYLNVASLNMLIIKGV